MVGNGERFDFERKYTTAIGGSQYYVTNILIKFVKVFQKCPDVETANNQEHPYDLATFFLTWNDKSAINTA
jgi:hypothetical protein